MEQKQLTGYPSLDKPWLKYYERCYDQQTSIDSFPKKTMYEWLYSCNVGRMKAVALRYFSKQITYEQLFLQIRRTACALRKLGVKPNEIVAICMPNTPEGIYSLYALNAIGAVSCMIDPRTAPIGMRNYVNEVKATTLIIIDVCAEKIADVIQETTLKHVIIAPVSQSMPLHKRLLFHACKVNTSLANYSIPWRRFMRNNGSEFQLSSYLPKALAVIGHTGGTTGIPKGVELTNDAYNALSYQQQQTKGFQRGKPFSALCHCFQHTVLPSASICHCVLAKSLSSYLSSSRKSLLA